jgi:hypothetical protein
MTDPNVNRIEALNLSCGERIELLMIEKCMPNGINQFGESFFHWHDMQIDEFMLASKKIYFLNSFKQTLSRQKPKLHRE